MSTQDKRKNVESPADLAAKFCDNPNPEVLVELIRRLMVEQESPEYISVSEVCERFTISRSTFDREKADGESGLAPILVKLRGRWLVPLREFEAWLRKREGGGRR